jgi:hypothetical protein
VSATVHSLPLRRSAAHWTADDPASAAAPRGWQRDVHALAAAIFDGADEERLRWVCADLADFLEHAGGRARLVFHACRLVTSWIGPLASGTLPPLRRLSLARRVRVLERLERGPLSMTVLGVKAMLSLVWYEHPRSARDIGFDGDCR